MRDKPLCSKCDRHHWHFQSCNKGLPVTIVRQPLPDGMREWGDRLYSITKLSDNVYVFPRKAEPVGRVTPPPEAA